MAHEENAFILIEYTLKYNMWGKISTKSANVFLPSYLIDLFAPHPDVMDISNVLCSPMRPRWFILLPKSKI